MRIAMRLNNLFLIGACLIGGLSLLSADNAADYASNPNEIFDDIMSRANSYDPRVRREALRRCNHYVDWTKHSTFVFSIVNSLKEDKDAVVARDAQAMYDKLKAKKCFRKPINPAFKLPPLEHHPLHVYPHNGDGYDYNEVDMHGYYDGNCYPAYYYDPVYYAPYYNDTVYYPLNAENHAIATDTAILPTTLRTYGRYRSKSVNDLPTSEADNDDVPVYMKTN